MNWVWNAFVEIGTRPWKRTPIISVNLVILDELLGCYLLGVLLGLRGYGIIQSFDESSWAMTMFFHFYLCGWWFGTFFDFPYMGNSNPNWLSYFSEGLKPPTSYFFRIFNSGNLRQRAGTSRLRIEKTSFSSSNVSWAKRLSYVTKCNK
jgi:hypothetical protein